MTSSKTVRVRFAPSPTGSLHIGSARAALFNWIFAKANNGTFVLRIEDTDTERSRPEFEEDIKNGLNWLGLNWDEFYKQSERSDIYREHLEKLLGEGKAYHCFCTKEDLEAQRQSMLTQGIAPKYIGTCRNLGEEEVKAKIDSGESNVIRFKVPEIKVEFKDMIRGNISFEAGSIGDVVVARSVDDPLYNFAVVVDDHLNEITHVIRGEDHISNTPLQILLIKALGFDEPEFGHLPIILNPDRSKMSKRFSDTALKGYIEAGYLPEAMVNFLAFLGWHPKEDIEIMAIDEIVKEFDMKRVQKGGAVFSSEKLDWLNSSYIKELSFERFVEALKGFVPNEWKLTPEILDSVRGRVEKLSEVKDLIDFYFEMGDYDTTLLRWRDRSLGEAVSHMKEMLGFLDAIDDADFNAPNLEKEILGKLPKESRGDTLWPVRVALSGRAASPGPFEIMGAIGKKESMKRIENAIQKTGMLDI